MVCHLRNSVLLDRSVMRENDIRRFLERVLVRKDSADNHRFDGIVLQKLLNPSGKADWFTLTVF